MPKVGGEVSAFQGSVDLMQQRWVSRRPLFPQDFFILVSSVFSQRWGIWKLGLFSIPGRNVFAIFEFTDFSLVLDSGETDPICQWFPTRGFSGVLYFGAAE